MITLPTPEEFAGRVAVVTGGSRGIGRSIVLGLADVGCSVTFCYRSDGVGAAAVCEEGRRRGGTGGDVVALQADVGFSDQAQRLVDAVLARHGHIDILVNNAGQLVRRPAIEIDDAEWDQTLRSNLYSAFYCSRAVLPGMMAARRGSIINIVSIAGKRGSANHAPYAAAKGGLLALTRTLAKEAIPYQVRVNAISPGRVATDMLQAYPPEEMARLQAEIPARQFGDPDDIARAVIFLASDTSHYIVGETLDVDGGLTMD